MMTLDYDIIMLALPRWDGLYSSTAFSLAKALSAHTRVFYIDNPFTIKDFISQRKSAQIQRRKKALLQGRDIFTYPEKDNKNLVAVTPKLVLPINWLSPGFFYDALSKINDSSLYHAINQTLESYDVKKYVFINSFNPLFGKYFPKQFSPCLNLYHCVDDISKSAYISKHGTRLEADAVRVADFTFVTSMELKRRKATETQQEIHYLPNAANVELFQQAVKSQLDIPTEMAGIVGKKKIICYTGNICHRLDYTLLKSIAEHHSDKVLLMVGPLSNENYKKAGLDKLSNVLFTGSKKIDELPAYLKYSDCCIIPFLCNQLTKSIYPLKINEYLSAGKPVVTTNFSEDITNFGDVAYVSSSHQEFLNNLNRAIDEDKPEKIVERVRYSSFNNWEARATQLIDVVNHYLNGDRRN